MPRGREPRVVPDWDDLTARFGEALVAVVHQLDREPEPFVIRPDDLIQETRLSREGVERFLAELVRLGYCTEHREIICPGCHGPVSPDDLGKTCPDCGSPLDGPATSVVVTYAVGGRRSRDQVWTVTVHGMNTRGAWQQDYAWRLSRIYGYAIPTFVYKYGHILVSPFVPRLQNVYRDRLVSALQERMAEVGASHGRRPDIIAHSFGTWLVLNALTCARGRDLRIGRLILTGSIVPPDFDWRPLLDSGRVEAVLCHTARKDFVVRLAPFFLPGSGPSGYRGMNHEQPVHHHASAWGHSGFFADANLDQCLQEVWNPFLTAPLGALPGLFPAPPAARPWCLRWWHRVGLLVRWGVLGLAFLLVTALLVALVLGVREMLGRLG